MKRLVIISGLLSGMFVTLVFLLNNPVSSAGLSGAAGKNAYYWNVLEFAGNNFSPAGLLGLRGDNGGSSLGAEEVALANASILLLQDSSGQPVAIATRLSSVSKGGDILSGNVGTETYTNIVWPNRGSVFMQGYENRWPLIRDDLLSVFGPSEDAEYAVSAAANDRADTGIVGGSGQLVGVGGSYSETLRPDPDKPGHYAGMISLITPTE
jgi:hypothetical protein